MGDDMRKKLTKATFISLGPVLDIRDGYLVMDRYEGYNLLPGIKLKINNNNYSVISMQINNKYKTMELKIDIPGNMINSIRGQTIWALYE